MARERDREGREKRGKEKILTKEGIETTETQLEGAVGTVPLALVVVWRSPLNNFWPNCLTSL